jgi:magnesium chelatase subunit D
VTGRPAFPFTAVVGADEAKTALLLAAADRHLGGVLLRGDKGAAKSTLARGLARLLPGDAPFVELPLGATEERVVGSLDLGAALAGGELRFQPGLLAEAHGGVLYVDEVNLLADHLVDVLLDAAASGINRVERDGVSHEHPARFVLIGSMNPEEGDLRPQLLDRFGLAVEVRNPLDIGARTKVVRRRHAYDADPDAFCATWATEEARERDRLAAWRPAAIDDALLEQVSAVCVAAGAESMRADIVLARAAAAHAGWRGAPGTELDDVRAVAHLVLAHRQRRDPFGDHARDPVDEALDAIDGATPDDGDSEPADETRATGDVHTADDERAGGEAPPPPTTTPPAEPVAVAPIAVPHRRGPGNGGRRSVTETDRGRTVGAREPAGSVTSVAVVPTLYAAARRRAGGPDGSGGGHSVAVTSVDLREPVRRARTGNLLVVAVDASGSMGADDRMAAVKGALLGLLVDAYQRRDRVALVTFAGDSAHVALRPTGSIEVARRRLEQIPTGGRTPLAEGIETAAELATRSATVELRPLLVLVTDGRATSGDDAWTRALVAAERVARRDLPSVVVDVESAAGGALGLAAELARAMGATHLPLPTLTAGRLESTLRSLT